MALPPSPLHCILPPYDLEHEARRTTLRFDDATIPPRADPLLAWLQERARPIPLKPREEP